MQIVRHPRAKRYVIRVRPDGTVRVTIPRWGSRRQALLFAEEQRPWIERQLSSVRTPDGGRSADDIAALRKRAQAELPVRLLELASTHGLSVSRVSVRNQRTRWGSCSPSGHICLNWRLVLMPPEVSDYVMLHELMHLRVLNHSRRFWRLVAAVCPDYEQTRRWLRENRHLFS